MYDSTPIIGMLHLLQLFPSAHIIVFDANTQDFLEINEGSNFHRYDIPFVSLSSFKSAINEKIIVGSTNLIELSINKKKDQYVFVEHIIKDAVVYAFVPCPSQNEIMDNLKNEISSDFLTGTMSRKSILEAAQRQEEKCRNGLHVSSFLMIDIDHFKRVNDTYGHDVGDIVLKIVSKTVKSVLREADMIGRLGGEEFLVILPSTSSHGATTVASKILSAVEGNICIIPNTSINLTVTVSIGIASMDSFVGSDCELTIKNADSALYAAKNNGRNCYECL